jgi:hypothetical protein
MGSQNATSSSIWAWFWFPAYPTWKASVDKMVIDIMRPLFDKGLKPKPFSNLLLEAHPAEFDKKRVRHESENQTRKKKL